MSQYGVRAPVEAERRSAVERSLRIIRAECRRASYRWGMAWYADDVYGAVVEGLVRHRRGLLISASTEEALLRWVARRSAAGELAREAERERPGLSDAIAAHSHGSRGLEAQSRRLAAAMAETVRLAAEAQGTPLRERIAEDVASLAVESEGYYTYAVEHAEREANHPTLASVARYLGLRPSEVVEFKRMIRESKSLGLA